MKCPNCAAEVPQSEAGYDGWCASCGLFMSLKDQLKEWMCDLDAEIKCLKKTHFGRHTQCIIELQAIQHEMNKLFEFELEKIK
jgi:hypothetical protein